VGGVSSLLVILGFLATVYGVVSGLLPVCYRLGTSLVNRKIAIFADTKFTELKNILIDSKLFREKNIVKVDNASLRRVEGISCYLVHYSHCAEIMNDILSMKKDSTAMIVYAPHSEGDIESSVLNRINNQPNSILVRLRGRLLNDIFISMITIGSAK
jgi:hypothetical protein